MSFSSLRIGASALQAAQRAVEVAAHNVANGTTEGFTRQRVEITTSAPTVATPGVRGDAQRGTGVAITSVERLRDRLADVGFRTEAATAGAADSRSSALDRAESALGPYGQGTAEELSRFYAAFDTLSLDPAGAAGRLGVLDAGASLAASLRATAQSLDTVALEVTERLTDQVSEADDLLRHVAGLNGAIASASSAGSQPNDLLDERDRALDRLSALIGARAVRTPGSGVDVVVGATALVTGATAQALTVTGDPARVALVDGSPLAVTGAAGGSVRVLNADLPGFRDQLDEVARSLRDRVNAVHTASTDLTGAAGTAFFTGTGAVDLAVRAGLTPSGVAVSRSGAPADGAGALAMTALRTERDATGQTVGDQVRAFTGRVGQAVAEAARTAQTADAGRAAAATTRASLNGVNVDEEMVDLVRYQHSYDAAARVVRVVDEMLDRLINGMGR